jgi:hypothetical protein
LYGKEGKQAKKEEGMGGRENPAFEAEETDEETPADPTAP